MHRRLLIGVFGVILGWATPGYSRHDSVSKTPWPYHSSTDSVIVLEGGALDSAWSVHRRALAAGVNQGRSTDMERYTIQVFSGKRLEATHWYGRLQDSLGTSIVLLHFDEPNFKVSVGIYPIRLAAEHDLKRWRVSFPQAFVVRAPNVQAFK